MLIVMAGLPGTGKSTLAHQLADCLPATILDKDYVRAALFPPAEIEYSAEQDDLCVRIMLQVAGYLLRKNRERYVLLDGRTFSRQYQVAEVISFAHGLGVPYKIIECVCSEETARLRLERDLAEGRHPATNRGYGLYQAVKARSEPVPEPKLVVDTDQDPVHCVRLCLAYVQGRNL